MEATRALRELTFNKLIIGLTGSAMDEDQKEFLDAGADLVFTKPLQTKYLEALLNYCEKNGFESRGNNKLHIHSTTGEIY